MKENMTFVEYTEVATNAAYRMTERDATVPDDWRPEDWRPGQTFFNILYDVRPDLADKVRGTDIDPFHQDGRLKDFLHWVGVNW